MCPFMFCLIFTPTIDVRTIVHVESLENTALNDVRTQCFYYSSETAQITKKKKKPSRRLSIQIAKIINIHLKLCPVMLYLYNIIVLSHKTIF